MKIRCLIERAGATTVMYAGKRFDFIPNKHGHSVCDVSNPGAVEYFLKTLAGNFYEEYEAPAEDPSEDEPGSEDVAASPREAARQGAEAVTGARARGNRSRKKKTESTEE